MEDGQRELVDIIVWCVSDKASLVGATLERLVFNPKILENKSLARTSRAFQTFYQIFLYGRFAHFAANSAILEVMPVDAEMIHIVDFDMGEGIQWLPIIEALYLKQKAVRLKRLKIGKGVECEWTPLMWSFEEAQRRLHDHARHYGVKLKVEQMELEELVTEIKKGIKKHGKKEWLAFNCMVGLPHKGRRRSGMLVKQFLKIAKELIGAGFASDNTNKDCLSGTPPTNPSVDYPSGDSDLFAKRARPIGISDVVNLPVNMLPVSFPGYGHSQHFSVPDDLPKTLVRTLNLGSSPMSMDFHPVLQTLLLVGTNVGDIGLWEVGSRERLVLRNFRVWDVSACSMPLLTALVKDPGVSVNRVIWSPDGSLFGVACSRHIVQLYSYHGAEDVKQHLEIDAHVGGVNDLAFSTPNKQLCVITCGDDQTIKVWDANTGQKQYTFEGHEAPVYSVFPHHKENIQFIFSTALDGRIKAWLYDNMGSRVDYEAPGRWCTNMAYSADGTRLFSCGTSIDGESHIVEWNESEGAVKRTYHGFRKRSLGVVQFDTTKNRFLAAGDDFSIKFWDMDNIQLLTSIDAEGGLPATPRIRFNKDGTLLAVSANDNGIKLLANTDGIRLLRTYENLSYDASRASEAVAKLKVHDM